jgi:type VI protein secretion system component VasA
MDAQDFRSLQEAYNKVHQLDEISSELAKKAGEERINRTFALMQKDWTSGRKTPSQEFQKSYKKQQDDERRYKAKLKKEQVDLYDIILSHLLDEGYAETPEAAEAIMVNMSEEWMGSIIG